MPRPAIRFGYAGIRVRNLARSLRFYRALGLKVVRRGTMQHGGIWVHLKLPGSQQRLELNYYPAGSRFHEPWMKGTEFDHFGFFVDDVDLWYARMRMRGAGIGAAPWSEFPTSAATRGERLAYVTDPDGNWVEFVGPARRPRLAVERRRSGR